VTSIWFFLSTLNVTKFNSLRSSSHQSESRGLSPP